MGGNVMDEKHQKIYDRINNLERSIKELSERIDKQIELFLDEDLKARGLK